VYLAAAKMCQLADVSVYPARYPEFSESKLIDQEYACTIRLYKIQEAAEVHRISRRGGFMNTEKRSPQQRPPSPAGKSPPPYTAQPTTVIRPTKGWVPVRLKDILQFRELLYFLIWSELKVRYKQTVLGAAWAVIQPLAIMITFTIFFGIVVRVPTGEIPYPIFAYSGVVVWSYFTTALSRASNSLLDQKAVITKVYFPRLVVPVASVLAGLVDFAVAFAALIALIFFYGFLPTMVTWTLPLFLLLAMITALSVSLWASALMAQYRDVRLLMNVTLQLWFFATPIIYPSRLVPESWRTFYEIFNPMVGVVEGFRWALLSVPDAPAPNPTTLAISTVLVVVVLVGGLYYFRRVERIFADVV
jgi:lipopolysaccharide transport system permease protein